MGSDVTKHLERAEKYLQKGKPESALEEYFAVLDLDGHNDAVRQNAADLCLTLGRNADAAGLLATLFERQAQAGETAKAAANYKKLARIGGAKVEQTLRFALLVEKTSRKEALEAYETSVRTLLAGGRKPEAQRALLRVVGLDPTTENLRRLGELSGELNDGVTASAAFLRAGEQEAANGAPALDWFRRAHQMNPASTPAAHAYARALLDAGEAPAAAGVLATFVAQPDAPPEIRDTYGQALRTCGRLQEAEPFLWQLYLQDNSRLGEIADLAIAYLENDSGPDAVTLLRRTQEVEFKAGRRREFVNMVKEIGDREFPSLEFLEFQLELFNQSNRESDYSTAALRLFHLYFAAGRFPNAADALDRAVEVDPYEAGHARRLEQLRNKIDARRFQAIAGRLAVASPAAAQPGGKPEVVFSGESTVLEDLMLQAEIFLQYSMRSKALERIERVHKLFPGEEAKNERMRALYAAAGFTPSYKDAPPTVVPPQAPASKPSALPVDHESAVDNFTRVTELTRNIYRQGSVKSVLFVAVNEVGRHYRASRCLAGLCTPGKPPSAALEYCASGVEQSDVMAIVRLIAACQSLTAEGVPVAVRNAATAPELASVHAQIAALGIQSLLAVPLIEADQPTGILILQQCDYAREWRPQEIVVARTIAEQMALAVSNAHLRNLMKTLSVTDENSGLLKRSSYLDVLLSDAKRCQQQNTTATVMLMHFGRASALAKEIGEGAVEAMMQQIGQAVCTNIRQNDVALRYELTSIALLLADTTEKNAFFVVDKMRKLLAATRVPGTQRVPPLTVGIAEMLVEPKFDPADVVTEVINRAEAALEQAHAEGGNKAVSRAAQPEAGAVA